MKLSASNLLCLMSGFLLLVTSINAEYEWNGDEWIWKEPGTSVDVSITFSSTITHERRILVISVGFTNHIA